MTFVADMTDRVDPAVVNLLAIVGGLLVARSALRVLGSLFTTFLRPGKNLKKYGSWAVVTGATGEAAAAAAAAASLCQRNRFTVGSCLVDPSIICMDCLYSVCCIDR